MEFVVTARCGAARKQYRIDARSKAEVRRKWRGAVAEKQANVMGENGGAFRIVGIEQAVIRTPKRRRSVR